MSNGRDPRPVFKLWFETDDGYVFGPGIYNILKKVEDTGTLKQAASSLGMSYRFAWGMIKKAEQKLGDPLIIVHKGGSFGGGGAKLSENGKKLLNDFIMLREKISLTLNEASKAKISGKIESIKLNDDKKIINIKQDDDTILNIIIPNSITSNSLKIGKHIELEYYINSLIIKN
jgi:molybdate transport repressor ModE-like protein